MEKPHEIEHQLRSLKRKYSQQLRQEVCPKWFQLRMFLNK